MIACSDCGPLARMRADARDPSSDANEWEDA